MAYADYGKGLESPFEDNKRERYKDKFTPQEVREIRAGYLNGKTQRQLSAEYGIHIKAVYNIIHLQTYPDVGLPSDMSLTEYKETLETLSNRKRS